MSEPDRDTRDIAVRALSEIQSHGSVCAQRAAENNTRMERMFSYIKEAHDDTSSQISDIVSDVSTIKQALITAASGTRQIAELSAKVESIQTTMAEQRGANQLLRLLGAAAVAALGAASGFFGGRLGH